MVGYWSFDGSQTNWATGQTADSSGLGNTGRLTSLSTSTDSVIGKVGSALQFNGTSAFVDVADNANLEISPSISVSFWMKADTLAATKPLVVRWTDVAVNQRVWGVGVNDTSGNLRFDTSPDGQFYAGNKVTSTGNLVGVGKWVHVVATSDGTVSRLYINGALNASATMTNPGLATSFSQSVRMGGATYGNANNFFDGAIDDVRVYSRALSDREVTALYSASTARVGAANPGQGVLGDGLVGYWTFDGSQTDWATGKTNDISGEGSAATLVAMATATSPTLGRTGQALLFDGVGSFVNPSTNFGQPSVLTISAWFKKSSLAAGAIFGQAAATPPSAPASFVPTIGVTTAGLLRGELWTGSIAGITSSQSVADNRWHHVALIGNSTIQHLYLDGALVGSRSGTISQSWWSTTQIGTGYDSGGARLGGSGTWRYFDGAIDDVRVYNRALSGDEVRALSGVGANTIGQTSSSLSGDNLVGHWPFDGSQTNWATGRTNDVSGSGNTGTLVSMSTTTSPAIGKTGQALQFNGSSYVDAGNASSVQITGPITVSAWIKPTLFPPPNTYKCIVCKGYNGTNTGYQFDFQNDASVGGVPRFFWGSFNGSVHGVIYDYSSTILLGQWAHLVGTWNGTQWALYLNGKVVGTSNDATGPVTTTKNLLVGALDVNGTLHYYQGSLDDVRVYNRALSGEEVRALYDMGN